MEAAIDFAQELSCIHRHWDKLFDEPAKDRGDQCSAHAVAHDITNKNPRNEIGNWKDVEEIASHRGRRLIPMTEFQSA